MEQHHDQQWPSTSNFVQESCLWLEKSKSEEERKRTFFRNKAFVVEKLDGTNVAKDDQGQLYSRRLFIPADAESFLKTSLNHVRYANIKLVKKKLCEKIGLEEHILEKLIVYGELIVNEKYDYRKRKLFSTWLVFGAAISVPEQNLELVSCKLKDGGFVFTIEGRRIRVFANSTFLTLAKECNLDTPVVKGENLSLYEIVLNNKNDMETGKMEGVIITVKDDVSDQHMIYKWKGAHENQPKSLRKVTEALETLEKEKGQLDDKIIQFFTALRDVVFADNDKNPLVKKVKKSKAKETDKVDTEKKLDKANKKFITMEIFSSMTKYEDVCVFINKNRDETIRKYKEIIKNEVFKDFEQEKGFQPTEDEKEFIKASVEGIINCKIKKFIHQQKMGNNS